MRVGRVTLRPNANKKITKKHVHSILAKWCKIKKNTRVLFNIACIGRELYMESPMPLLGSTWL